jgi:hypothetical protein
MQIPIVVWQPKRARYHNHHDGAAQRRIREQATEVSLGEGSAQGRRPATSEADDISPPD